MVGVVDPRRQRPRVLRLDGATEAERIALAQLAYERPRFQALLKLHGALSTAGVRGKTYREAI